ncbi:hypothetical protein [Rufibacter sp. LB8]|uniref:hypothetical protein n=1 Tax=Rufibacter sp. LB8 TaxID=2777781 RepID=UPI00178C6FE0|nr:hypothetical protein [Rufibacter sp. LB8]
MEKVVKIGKLKEQESDFQYWKKKTPQERLAALEVLRQQYMQFRKDVHPRLQRVYSVISCRSLDYKRKKIEKAVRSESEQELKKVLDFRHKEDFGPDEYDLIKEALFGTWHSQHEDLVNMIYLENLMDDRFVEPIVAIALNKEVYRRYDDELESTLRKCVHALKAINSEKSNQALEKLEKLGNDNIRTVMEMYRKNGI